MREPIHWKGRWRPLAQVRISPLNSALLYGESLVEAVPIYGGRPLFWGRHLARLAKGCRFLGWPMPPKADFQRVLGGIPPSPDSILRIGLFQEMAFPANPRDLPRGRPQWFAFTRPLRHDPRQARFPQGKVGIARWRVASPDAYPGGFKWIFYMMIRKEFREHPEWAEMLRLDRQGHVADGGSSSPLWVSGGKVMAPPLENGGLESVTRAEVLKMARRMGLKVLLERWRPSDAMGRGELLFVGSGIGIFRATHLGGKKLPGPGPVAQRLWDAYRSLIARSGGPGFHRASENAMVTGTKG